MSPRYKCIRKVITSSKLKLKHKKTYDYPLIKNLMVKGVMKKAGVALSSEIKAMKIKIRESEEAGIECHPTMKASTSDISTIAQQKVTPSTEQQRIPATFQTRQSETDNQNMVEDSDDYTR